MCEARGVPIQAPSRTASRTVSMSFCPSASAPGSRDGRVQRRGGEMRGPFPRPAARPSPSHRRRVEALAAGVATAKTRSAGGMGVRRVERCASGVHVLGPLYMPVQPGVRRGPRGSHRSSSALTSAPLRIARVPGFPGPSFGVPFVGRVLNTMGETRSVLGGQESSRRNPNGVNMGGGCQGCARARLRGLPRRLCLRVHQPGPTEATKSGSRL